MLWLPIETLSNLSVNFCFGVTIERQSSGDQHVEDDSERPDVTLVLVVLVYDLWSHEVRGASDFVHALASLFGQAKVDELDFTQTIIHNVLGLYVSVHDVHRVAMLQRSKTFLNHVRCNFLRVLLALLLQRVEAVEKLSTRAVLHDKI